MHNEYLTFSQLVRQRRQALHLTQQQLGALSGCATETIRKIEADLRRPSHKVALLLAQALQLPPEVYPAFVRGSRDGIIDAPTVINATTPEGTPAIHSRPPEAPPNNLPIATSSLIGREAECVALQLLLADPQVRLVTLTGPGGVGKTRLAIATAEATQQAFPDGRFFVSLAPIVDPALVLPTIAQSLDVKEVAGKPLLATVQAFLHQLKVLLVIDNFEQVLSAGLVIAELLQRAPQLTVLVTSRAPLRLIGEHEHEVHPLAVPSKPEADLLAMSRYTAVRLFIERAQAVKAEFRFNDSNVLTVAEICARLDGIPLAIELAAARIKILQPQALLQRLGSRLQMLTGGPHDLPTRHQTMRTTIDWSYSLLHPAEQLLFAQLAVFAGGFSPEAAEAMQTEGAKLTPNVLDGIQSLVNQSMLQQLDGPQGEPRFGMLETINEYALERLAAGHDAHAARLQHALYFLALAELAEPQLTRGEQQVWLERLEVEHDNVRAALRWALQQGEQALALRLCNALARFWWTRAHLHEGRSWLEQTLSLGEVHEPTLRARGLFWVAMLTTPQGDYAAAEQALRTSLTLTQHAGDHFGIGLALNALGSVANAQGDHGRARKWYEEGLVLYQTLGDQERVATLLNNLGFTKLLQQEYQQAALLLEESLHLARALEHGLGIAFALNNLGLVALRLGDPHRAQARLTESLARFWALRDQRNSAEGLESLSELAASQGQPVRAARLLAAASELRVAIYAPPNVHEQHQHDATLATIRRTLDEPAFALAWSEGKRMSLADAIGYALFEDYSGGQ